MKRPWSKKLVYNFFLSYLAIVILLSVGFFIYSSNLLRDAYIVSLGSVMEHKARVLAPLLPWSDEPGSLDSICRRLSQELGGRITVVARDGTVIGDSDAPAIELENHGSRPEVMEAFSGGSGGSVRHSTSVNQELLYRAYRDTQGHSQRIVRVAVSLNDIQVVTASLGRTLFFGLLLCCLSGLVVAYFFSRRLSKRINGLVDFSRAVARGDFRQRFLPRNEDDELHVLEQNLHEMSLKIRDNINEVRSEKDKFDSILTCMVEGLLVLDPKGNVLLINEQARRMFHVTGDQIQTGSFVEISRSPEMRKVVQEVMAFDFSQSVYSRRVSLEDGRWFRVNAVSLRNGTERTSGSILVFHDITEIERLETVRSDFVANVSHELRTPLTAIRGYVETLLNAPPTDPRDSQQFLDIIARHSERLSRLTEDLLILSDLESGKVHLSRQLVDTGHLIQRVLEVFWDQAAKKQVQLSQIVAPGLPPLSGDFDRLQQLFINLVDNAVKYTPGGGRVTISATRAPATNGAEARVEIAVADTGPGIPEKDLPRLTERFYRVDKARSRDMGGTGLGLAIVKHIVQAHKGELTIQSVLGKGTIFRVLLPAAEPPANPRADSLPLNR
jgi:two-component system, OmpR family, phosphate regulon sensor histidine kinase PhoR